MALCKEDKTKIIEDFRQGEQDTGSAEVQIALLTKNIRELTDHCKKNPKDFSSNRGLFKMVCKRRTFLRYLEKKNQEKYKNLIQRLELRK